MLIERFDCTVLFMRHSGTIGMYVQVSVSKNKTRCQWLGIASMKYVGSISFIA